MLKHGFILILLALISGLWVDSLKIPRLGLASHTIGILSGILLIAVGAIWQQFQLTYKQRQLTYGAWLYSSYMNWFACLAGAALGTGKATPIASAGIVGTAVAEGMVTVMLVSVALVSFLAVGLSIWGLRSKKSSAE